MVLITVKIKPCVATLSMALPILVKQILLSWIPATEGEHCAFDMKT